MKKILLWIVIVLGLVCIVVTATSAVYHHLMLEREEQVLNEYGVGQKSDVEGIGINVFSYGNQEAAAALVFMSDLGTGDAAITVRPMFSKLQEAFRIFVIDRAGHGMSDDTKAERTVEAIVQEYRQALEKSNQKAPYYLMAHGIAGIYAEYWASKYAQEVAGIIYLDSTPAEIYAEAGEPDSSDKLKNWLQNFFCRAGLQRFFVPKTTLIGDEEKNLLSEQERERCLFLMYHNTFSRAVRSEKELACQNALTVLENLNINAVPQLYLAANCLEGRYYEEIFRGRLEEMFEDDEEGKREYVQKLRGELGGRVNYAVVHGNVAVQYISGPHDLYRYAPNEIAEAVRVWCGLP